jgi:heme A synthase
MGSGEQGAGSRVTNDLTLRPPRTTSILSRMEFLNFLIIIWAAWLLWRRPENERLAFRLLILSCIVMAVLFLIGTHTSLIPRINL